VSDQEAGLARQKLEEGHSYSEPEKREEVKATV
jgi:hypothetical protein